MILLLFLRAITAPGVEFASDSKAADEDLCAKTLPKGTLHTALYRRVTQNTLTLRHLPLRLGADVRKPSTKKIERTCEFEIAVGGCEMQIAVGGPVHAVAVPIHEDRTAFWKALLIFALLLLSGNAYMLYFPAAMVPAAASRVTSSNVQMPAAGSAPSMVPTEPVSVVPASFPSAAPTSFEPHVVANQIDFTLERLARLSEVPVGELGPAQAQVSADSLIDPVSGGRRDESLQGMKKNIGTTY